MVENLKAMTDEEIINFINKIVTDNEDLEIKDLKAILAEISGRKMEKKYINVIAEKIKAKLQPEPGEERRKKEPVKEEILTKPTFDDIYTPEYDDEDDEEEKYPVMSFLVGLYRIFAIIFLIGVIAIAGVISLLVFKEQIVMVCAIMFGSIILGIFLFIGFYGMAEKLKLYMDIERHLEDLLGK